MAKPTSQQQSNMRGVAEEIVAARLAALGFSAGGIPSVIREELVSNAESEFAAIGRKVVPDWAAIGALIRKFKDADPAVAQKREEKEDK